MKKKTADNNRIAWVIVLAAILAVSLVRLRLLGMPLERDEGEYAYMAQLLLRGIPPYVGAYSMKFPGIYAAYAGIIALFGQTIEGIRAGLILVNTANILLLFLLARRLIGTYGGVVAAAFYAFSSLDPNFFGLSANAEHFVTLPVLAGLLVLVKALDSGKGRFFLLSGLFLGAALVIKQHGIFFGIFGFLYLVWHEHKIRNAAYMDIARCAAFFAAGAALPLVVTCAALYMVGALDKFWFWAVSYGARYVNCLPLKVGLTILIGKITKIALSPAAPLYLTAIAGIAVIFVKYRKKREGIFILGFFAASILALAQGMYFRGHYFLFILPPLAILAGAAIRWRKGLIPALLAVSILSYYVFGNADIFFQKKPAEVTRALYGANPFPEAAAIVEHIRSSAGKDYSIAVLGSEPEIYFYLNKQAPTRYIYMYPLLEPQPLFLTMQEEMVRDITAAAPDYVVYVHVRTSWHEYEEFIGTEKYLFDWTYEYLPKNYDVAGIISIINDKTTIYRWGDPLTGYVPESDCYIMVLKARQGMLNVPSAP